MHVVASEMVQASQDNRVVTAWQDYRSALYRFILKRVRDKEAAEDIVQEVLLKALEKQGAL